MQIQPYLFFEGRCEEALEFYRTALGAEILSVMRWKDSPEAVHAPPGGGDKVMHAELRVGESTILASDGMSSDGPSFKGFHLCIITKTPAEVDRYFAALSKGGQVTMPLAETFFSPRFGMLTDRFGMGWMLYADKS